MSSAVARRAFEAPGSEAVASSTGRRLISQASFASATRRATSRPRHRTSSAGAQWP